MIIAVVKRKRRERRERRERRDASQLDTDLKESNISVIPGFEHKL